MRQKRRAPLGTGDIRLIAQTPAVAKRPLVICGPRLTETRSDGCLETLRSALNAPGVAMESPRGMKDPALGDLARASARADFILNLGKLIDFTLGFGNTTAFEKYCKWIVLEADADERSRAHLNLGARLAARFAADPRDIIGDLISAAHGNAGRSEWRAEVAELIAARGHSETEQVDGSRISPAQLCAAVRRQLNKAVKSVMICDGGEFGHWAQAATQGDRRIVKGISGAIGEGLCYGLGAKLAATDALVFALMGDGTVGFHLAEFETAAPTKTPFVVVVGNSHQWNAEHQIQLRDYSPDRLIGCELSDARYDEVVKGLGGHGEYVTKLAELGSALDRAVKCGKVACVNVIIKGVPAPSGSAH